MKRQNSSALSIRNPNETVAHLDDRKITVGELISQALILAAELPKHRYVLNQFTDRYQYLLGFCATVIAGQCTLMPPNRLASTLGELKQIYSDSYTLKEAHLACLLAKQQHSLKQTAPKEFPLIPDNQLCAIAFTSGSTGDPTPNLKYWKTLRCGSLGNATLLLKGETERVNLLATVPAQHMWGFETSILMPLFANVAVSHRSPFYPQDVVEALEALPAPRALVSSPFHLNTFLRSALPPPITKYIYSATAPLSTSLAKQLEDRFDARVVEVFGSSESGILARRHTATESLWQISNLFRLDSRKDRIHVIAKHLPDEVLLNDRLELIDDRHFKWLGRHQDMINIAGKRDSLANLNRRLLAIDGVIDGVIFFPEEQANRLVALVVAPDLRQSEIIQSLKKVVDPLFLPRPVYMVSGIPRLETGKIAKKQMMSTYKNLIKSRINAK